MLAGVIHWLGQVGAALDEPVGVGSLGRAGIQGNAGAGHPVLARLMESDRNGPHHHLAS